MQKIKHKTMQDRFLEMNGVNLHFARYIERSNIHLGSITTTTKISLIVAAIVKILIAQLRKKCISRDLNYWLKMALFNLPTSRFPYMILGTS